MKKRLVGAVVLAVACGVLIFASCVGAEPAPYVAEGVIEYEVEEGDTLFSIAEEMGVEPDTILYSNYGKLEDDPTAIQPGVTLSIPPVNGVYYEWKEGDTLDSAASTFNVEASAIVEWPGNGMDAEAFRRGEELAIPPGSRIVIPGGKREFTIWKE